MFASKRAVAVIATFVAVALILLAAAAVLSYRSVTDVEVARRHVAHTQVVLRQTQRVLRLVTDAETGQRGYLLTGEREYLTPYEHAVRDLPAELQRLREMTAGDAVQQRRVETAGALVDRRVAELRSTVASGQRGDAEVAIRTVRTGEGARLMDRIRVVLGDVINHQSELLSRQQDAIASKARASRNVTIAAISGATVATMLAVLFAIGAVVARQQLNARRAQESVVRDAARRVAAVVDNSDDAIIGEDLDGIVTSWNVAAERMFGYAAAEMIGRPVTLLIPPERRREGEELRHRLRQGERIDHLQTVRQAKDGRLVDVALTITPLTDGSGTLLGASRIVRDLTESKQTHEALQRSEATALAFIESAAEGILIVDERGHIAVANGVVEKMFGYAQRELIGQRLEMLLPERLRDRHVGHRAAYAAEPRVRSMGRGLDLAGRRRDGTEFPVEISLSYVRTPHGLQVMAFVTDITERLMLELTARQSEKLAALGTLSAGLAHELNNPLAIISSRIELMLLEGEDERLSPTVREDLAVIHRQVQRVARLAQGLLAYARPSDGQRRPVDLNHVVAEIVRLADKQFVKDGVRIVLSLDPTLPRVLGNAGALEQVLLNMLTNAQQAMDGTGEIRIITRLAPAAAQPVQLVVADTGRGIPADVLAKIFDPFFTTKSSGTGLGLSITNRIIQDHDGTIDIRSAPGEGTEFTLKFPAAAAAQPEA